MKVKVNKIFSVIILMILCLAAIQNRFFDTILNVAGMDFISLILSIFIIIAFFIVVIIKKMKFNQKDIAINLYFLLFALLILLFVDVNNKMKITKYFMCFIILIAIITFQQRSIIIPLIVTAIFYIISNIKFNFKSIFKILGMILIVFLVIRLASNIGMFKFVVNRFSNGAITSEDSTLWIRINTAKEYLKGIDVWHLLFDTGLAGRVELEMLIPNYIYKYGILGSIFLVIAIYIPAISVGIKNKDNIKRFILISLLIMSIGGLISGFNGQNGQLLIASILGILLNDNIQVQSNIKFNMKLVEKNKLEMEKNNELR